jgi:prefoldin subunit 5
MIPDLDVDDYRQDREDELKKELTKLSNTLKEYDQLISSLENEIRDLESQATQSKIKCEQLEAEISNFNQRYELERRITGLEFLLNEEYPEFLEESDIQEFSNELEILNKEIKVIEKSIKETKKRIEYRQKDLLVEVSKKIQEYAIHFGMTSLEKVELKAHPQLHLKKDGVSTTYSRCTDGEKLRLKIASVIALISIAENQGIGRHPGLLLIDSPKREEITDKDVAQIVAGLDTLTKELPYLQVFLAATASEGILGYFDEDHRKYAKGDDFLW